MPSNITKTIKESLENAPRGSALYLSNGDFEQVVSFDESQSHLLQSQIRLIDAVIEKCQGMVKRSSFVAPLCRSCKYMMAKSKGMGKIVFNWHCPNCGNSQEYVDDFSTNYNKSLEDQISSLEEVKKLIENL